MEGRLPGGSQEETTGQAAARETRTSTFTHQPGSPLSDAEHPLFMLIHASITNSVLWSLRDQGRAIEIKDQFHI
jgi:hypothetical protein